MRTVIIEDELPSIETLTLLLQKYCPDVVVTGVARSFREAYELCRQLQPELIFCDVQIQDEEGTGLSLVQLLNDKHIKVIFITGWKDFAVDAFRVSAVDYLLKPVNIHELIRAVEKARQQPIIAARPVPDQIQIPTQHGFLVMPQQEIIRCQADGPYTHFHFSNKQGKKTSSVTLGLIATRLPESAFFRVHKTHMINRAHIVEYIRGEGGMVRMTDNFEVPISRLAKDAFMKWLG